MTMWIPNGCELTHRGRSDLREAIRCILLAGAVLAGSHPEVVLAQESVRTFDTVTSWGTWTPTVDVAGVIVTREAGISTPARLSFGGATVWIDGVREDFYPSPIETHTYENPTPVTVEKNPEPDLGGCRGKPGTVKDNPVDIANGSKHVTDVDFQSISNPDLKLTRYKNPRWRGVGIFGQSWISNLDVKIASDTCEQEPGKPSCEISASSEYIKLYTEKGGIRQFQKPFHSTAGIWEGINGETGYITRVNDGSADTGKFVLYTRAGIAPPQIKFRRNGQIESIKSTGGNNLLYTYDAGNRLTMLTHASGRSITLSWTASTPGAVTSVVAPNGAPYSFEYYSYAGGPPLLKKVNYPDGKGNVEYIHPSGPSYLTQIKVNGQALKNYTYHSDTSGAPSGMINGTVASTSFADGTNLIRYFYFVDGYPENLLINRSESINGYGKKTTYLLKDQMLVETIGEASVHCSATVSKATYDEEGLLQATASESGVTTQYEYDSNRRKVREIEALGTALQRTTTWLWDNDPSDMFRTDLIKKITVEGHSSIAYEYEKTLFPIVGMLSSITSTNLTANGVPNASQTIAFNYTLHPNGLVASIVRDGPLPGASDYEKMSYNSMGDLISVQNSIGQLQTFAGHNGFGQPGRIVDFAGAVTEYEYDARGRVVVERHFPNGSPVEKRYVYGASGLLDAVAQTDGNTTYYHYDAAQRLVQEELTEPGGSHAVKRYTYDVMSNPIKIEVGRDQ